MKSSEDGLEDETQVPETFYNISTTYPLQQCKVPQQVWDNVPLTHVSMIAFDINGLKKY